METVSEIQKIMNAAAAFETADPEITDCVNEHAAFAKAIIDAIRSRIGDEWQITEIDGSMGSSYYDIHRPYWEDACIRISNHPRGVNGESTPAWSFETTDRREQIERGLTAVAGIVAALEPEEI